MRKKYGDARKIEGIKNSMNSMYRNLECPKCKRQIIVEEVSDELGKITGICLNCNSRITYWKKMKDLHADITRKHRLSPQVRTTQKYKENCSTQKAFKGKIISTIEYPDHTVATVKDKKRRLHYADVSWLENDEKN